MRTPAQVYPELGLSSIRLHLSGAFRIWTLARSLDQVGRGSLLTSDLLEHSKGLHVKRATFYRWLAQARNAGIITEGKPGVLYLSGLARVSSILEVDRITRRVNMPPSKLAANGWRAYVFASIHNGKPTSRQTLKAITGISPRTQSRYDRVARTKRKKSILITDMPASHLQAVKEFSTEPTAFVYYDKKNKRRVVAHRRPDIRKAYGSPEPIRSKWEINLKLQSSADTCNYSILGLRGNGIQKIFFPTMKKATAAAIRNGKLDLPQVDTFYPTKRTASCVFYLSI